MKEITANDFGDLNDGLVVIDFYAPWCGPCKMMKPILERLDSENQWFNIYSLNTDDVENADIVTDLSIRSLPTLKIYKDGKEVESLTGAVPGDKLLTVLNKHK